MRLPTYFEKRRPARRFSCAALVLFALGAHAQVADTGTYLQRMDSNGDGKVSVDEYVDWMMYAFDRMDRNGDGTLSADELPGGRGKAISRDQQRQTIIERFHKQDANGDGFLSARELSAPPR